MSALARAIHAWGEPPDWVVALAAACDQASQAKVAEQVGYCPATVSLVLRNRYGADLTAVERRVRDLLMRETVACPVLGEIAAAQCHDEQRRPYTPTNHQRVRLYHACRDGCQHSRIKGGTR